MLMYFAICESWGQSEDHGVLTVEYCPHTIWMQAKPFDTRFWTVYGHLHPGVRLVSTLVESCSGKCHQRFDNA